MAVILGAAKKPFLAINPGNKGASPCSDEDFVWSPLVRVQPPNQAARLSASTAFSPPKAKELLSTARTGISRAWLGT